MEYYNSDIEIEARRVLDEYKARRFGGQRMPYRTRLEQQGAELDAVRCYLSGLNIKEAVQFLKTKRNVSVSHTGLARLYRDLFLHKVYPNRRLVRV